MLAGTYFANPSPCACDNNGFAGSSSFQSSFRVDEVIDIVMMGLCQGHLEVTFLKIDRVSVDN